MTTDEVFDLLDHAIEPEPWQCDGPWEYRAMHWRPSEASSAGLSAGAAASAPELRSLAGSLPG
jgi:hypothetical protein